MQINQNILEELCREAGNERVERARKYIDQNRVRIKREEYEDSNNFEIEAEVRGTDIYDTTIKVKNGEIEDVTCECEDYFKRFGACKHIVATIIAANEENKRETNQLVNTRKKANASKYKTFHQIIKYEFGLID